MVQKTWSVRILAPKDLDAIRELYNVVFRNARPLAHDLWKFWENPIGPAIGMVAEDRGRIVGQFVLLPTQLRLGNEVILGAQSVDTMTHPDYRSQGMFVELAKACMDHAIEKGIEVLYGFPNMNSYPGFIRRLNWDHTNNIPCLIRILNPKMLPYIPSHLKPMAALGVHLLRRGNSSPSGVEICIGRPFEKDLEYLLGEWRAMKDLCRIERSVEWIEWRFHPNSQHAYEWVTAYRSGKIRAIVIWGIRELGEGVLAELLGTDSEALEAATSVAIQRAKEKGVGSLMAVTNHRQAIRTLRSCGFIQKGGVALIVRSMSPRTLDGNIHSHTSWRIISADIDTF